MQGLIPVYNNFHLKERKSKEDHGPLNFKFMNKSCVQLFSMEEHVALFDAQTLYHYNWTKYA